MIELVSGALSLLWVLCVTLKGFTLGNVFGGNTPRRLTNSRVPLGREYRHIGRYGGRLVALRLQVILC